VVVHFDPPGTDKDYVHRSGRTGRAGAEGLVVTLVPPDKAKDVRTLQRALGMRQSVEPARLEAVAGGRATAPATVAAPAPADKPRQDNRPRGAARPKPHRGKAGAAGRSGKPSRQRGGRPQPQR
jgi:superfamily II DNA/RNA helicase